MRQFDVFHNPIEGQRTIAPYYVVLSSHHLRALNDVVVAPLIRDWNQSLSEVDVEVRWRDERLLLALSEMFSLEARQLRDCEGNISDVEDDIRRAIERLFTGF